MTERPRLGRPPKYGEPTVRRNIAFPQSTLARLKEVAAECDASGDRVSVSELVVDAVREWLAMRGKDD